MKLLLLIDLAHRPVGLLAVILILQLTDPVQSQSSCSLTELEAKLIDLILNTKNLNFEQPSAPVSVELRIRIRDFSILNELDNQGGLLLEMHMAWKDPRLVFGNLSCTDTKMSIPQGLIPKVWIPPVKLETGIRAFSFGAPSMLKTLKVKSDGTVMYNWLSDMFFPCSTDYRKYPFDEIVCDVVYSAWTTNEFVRVNATTNPSVLFSMAGTSRLATFKPVIPPTLPYETEDTGRTVYFSRYVLRRLYTYHILQIFIPNLVTVLVAYSSFWFPLEDIRASILMSMLLTSAVQYSSVSGSLPKVGYLKGIDLWMLGVVGLIFFCLMEYSVIRWILEKLKKDKEEKEVERYREHFVRLDSLISYGFLVSFGAFLGIYLAVFVFGYQGSKGGGKYVQDGKLQFS